MSCGAAAAARQPCYVMLGCASADVLHAQLLLAHAQAYIHTGKARWERGQEYKGSWACRPAAGAVVCHSSNVRDVLHNTHYNRSPATGHVDIC